MSKIKVKDIEGSKEDVVAFFRDGGVDLNSYINSSRKIEVPVYYIIGFSIAFIIFLCIIICLSDEYVKIKAVLSILALACAFINVAFIYMSWKNKTLSSFVIIAELILFGLSHSLYTPKDVIDKAEDFIERLEGK